MNLNQMNFFLPLICTKRKILTRKAIRGHKVEPIFLMSRLEWNERILFQIKFTGFLNSHHNFLSELVKTSKEEKTLNVEARLL